MVHLSTTALVAAVMSVPVLATIDIIAAVSDGDFSSSTEQLYPTPMSCAPLHMYAEPTASSAHPTAACLRESRCRPRSKISPTCHEHGTSSRLSYPYLACFRFFLVHAPAPLSNNPIPWVTLHPPPHPRATPAQAPPKFAQKKQRHEAKQIEQSN